MTRIAVCHNILIRFSRPSLLCLACSLEYMYGPPWIPIALQNYIPKQPPRFSSTTLITCCCFLLVERLPRVLLERSIGGCTLRLTDVNRTCRIVVYIGLWRVHIMCAHACLVRVGAKSVGVRLQQGKTGCLGDNGKIYLESCERLL